MLFPLSAAIRFGPATLTAAVLAFAGPVSAQSGAPPPGPGASAAQPHDKSSDKPVARVDGATITEGDVAIAADDPGLSLPGMSESQKHELLVSYLVDLKLGAAAAEAAKVGEGPEFARKLAYFRSKLLLDEYLEREVRKAVTPDAVRKVYDETVKGMKPEQEVRARHILVETEDEAKKVQARLKAGEDFAKVAAEVSKDPGSKTDGGDLGWFTKDRMVAPFSEVAFKLEPGQISEPVKTQFGWHVIKVEEKRTKPVPSFEEMKEQIETYLARKTQQDIILALRQKAKIERLDQPAKPAEGGGKPPAAPNK
jgi:peptidyl-prolyl cis-trans isomerase C